MNEELTIQAAEAAGMRQLATPWALCMDAFAVALVFAFKVAVLWFTVRTISRHMAAIHIKALILTTLGLAVVYLFANPMYQTDELFVPMMVLVLVATLVIKRAFWVSIDHAGAVAVIVCLLSVAAGDLVRRGMDTLFPMRATINASTAAAIDRFVVSNSGDTNLPPSLGTLPALVRLTVTTNTEGALGTMLAFLRAGLEAKEQVERLRRQAEMEARIANLLGGGGTNLTATKAQEMASLKAFFNESTNRVAGPPPRFSTNAVGFTEAYAHAKAQIIEVNRIASNNAMIVNMLSGAGTNVGNRAEEMAKLQAALIAEAQAQGIDLSMTNPVDRAVLDQAMANVTGEAVASDPELEKSLVQAFAADMMVRQHAELDITNALAGISNALAEATTLPADESWKLAAAEEDGLPEAKAGTNALSLWSVEPGATGLALPPGSLSTAVPGPDMAPLILALLTSTVPSAPADGLPAAKKASKPKQWFTDMKPEEVARWREARRTIKVTGVVHSPTDASCFVSGRLVRQGDVHVVRSGAEEYAFRLRGVNDKGQCVWEPVVPTDEQDVTAIAVGF
jgi:hypothetical protein